MSFLSKLRAKVTSIAGDIGEGFVKVGRAVGHEPSDAEIDKLGDLADRIATGVENVVTKELAHAPGMPDWAAQMITQAALAALSTIQAGLIEGAKAANKD